MVKAPVYVLGGLPWGLSGKESTCQAVDVVSIPGWRGSPGKGSGHLLYYSCLENSIDRGAWWATDHEVANSWTQLND